MTKDYLTSERFRKLFKNKFDMANYAIHLAHYYVKSGHEINADEILEEVRKNPNPSYLDDLKAAEKVDEEHEASEK